MGFIVKHFTVTTGDSDFPSGTGNDLIKLRQESCLTKSAQLLLDCNVGWQLDVDKSPTTSSYIQLNTTHSSFTYPSLFFKNSISGCKLMMAYYGHNMYSLTPIDFSGNDFLKFSSNSTRHGGIIISIIPGESSDEFGDANTAGFIPNSATRLCGTFYRNDTNGTDFSAAYNPRSGMSYTYWLGATPSTVFTYVNNSFNNNMKLFTPIYACGKIFGTLYHKSDNLPTAKYGTVLFRNQTGQFEGYATIYGTSYTSEWLYNSSTACVNIGANPGLSSSLSSLPTAGAFHKSNGDIINGKSGNGSNSSAVVTFAESPILLSPNICSSDVSRQWVAIGMGSICNYDLDEFGVVSGNGFKGYLDTDLFRLCFANRGDTFDNDSFACLETTGGIIVGWHKSNSEQWL